MEERYQHVECKIRNIKVEDLAVGRKEQNSKWCLDITNRLCYNSKQHITDQSRIIQSSGSTVIKLITFSLQVLYKDARINVDYPSKNYLNTPDFSKRLNERMPLIDISGKLARRSVSKHKVKPILVGCTIIYKAIEIPQFLNNKMELLRHTNKLILQEYHLLLIFMQKRSLHINDFVTRLQTIFLQMMIWKVMLLVVGAELSFKIIITYNPKLWIKLHTLHFHCTPIYFFVAITDIPLK